MSGALERHFATLSINIYIGLRHRDLTRWVGSGIPASAALCFSFLDHLEFTRSRGTLPMVSCPFFVFCLWSVFYFFHQPPFQPGSQASNPPLEMSPNWSWKLLYFLLAFTFFSGIYQLCNISSMSSPTLDHNSMRPRTVSILLMTFSCSRWFGKYLSVEWSQIK